MPETPAPSITTSNSGAIGSKYKWFATKKESAQDANLWVWTRLKLCNKPFKGVENPIKTKKISHLPGFSEYLILIAKDRQFIHKTPGYQWVKLRRS
jgi:hypothetical protein